MCAYAKNIRCIVYCIVYCNVSMYIYKCLLSQLGGRVFGDLVRDVAAEQCELQPIVPAHHLAVRLGLQGQGPVQQCQYRLDTAGERNNSNVYMYVCMYVCMYGY